ncbi:MAG: hypothetical protein U5L09_00075 [Bacteroidales bacterium]|nr:hypothetical protein [Bacteroidales bacterium]
MPDLLRRIASRRIFGRNKWLFTGNSMEKDRIPPLKNYRPMISTTGNFVICSWLQHCIQ